VLRALSRQGNVCCFPRNPISPVTPGRNSHLPTRSRLHLRSSIFLAFLGCCISPCSTLHSTSNTRLAPRGTRGRPHTAFQSGSTHNHQPSPGVESANPQASAVSTPKGSHGSHGSQATDDNGPRWEGDPDGLRAALKPTWHRQSASQHPVRRDSAVARWVPPRSTRLNLEPVENKAPGGKGDMDDGTAGRRMLPQCYTLTSNTATRLRCECNVSIFSSRLIALQSILLHDGQRGPNVER
jgi:hypothetical protein